MESKKDLYTKLATSIKGKKEENVGIEVPVGGSCCSTCEYLSKDGLKCKNKDWIKWHKEDDKLPFPANRYCCNYYEWD